MKRLVSILLALTVCAALAAVVWANGGTVTVVSDTSVMVYGPLDHYAPLGHSDWGTTPNSAVATWVHGSWPWKTDPDGAKWISTSYLIGQDGGSVPDSSWRWFTKSVDLCPGVYNNIAGTITATSDNAEDVYVNGVKVGFDGEVQDPWHDDYEWGTIIDYPFTVSSADTLTLDFIVRNYPGNPSPYDNPTGLIFKAVITYECGPVPVEIDIKPGSYPNCFNVNGHGVIPVAILGSADLDVTQIDVSTLSFGGLDVRVKGNGTPQCSVEDVSGDFTSPEGAPDGYDDLVCQFVDDSDAWTPDAGTATLTGNLTDGTPIEGSDSICIRPPE